MEFTHLTKLVVRFESNGRNTRQIHKKVEASFWIWKEKKEQVLDRDWDDIKEAVKEMFSMFKDEHYIIDIYTEYDDRIVIKSTQRFIVDGLYGNIKQGVKDHINNRYEFVESKKSHFFKCLQIGVQDTLNFYQGKILESL